MWLKCAVRRDLQLPEFELERVAVRSDGLGDVVRVDIQLSEQPFHFRTCLELRGVERSGTGGRFRKRGGRLGELAFLSLYRAHVKQQPDPSDVVWDVKRKGAAEQVR
jgi:hypothetical protein